MSESSEIWMAQVLRFCVTGHAGSCFLRIQVLSSYELKSEVSPSLSVIQVNLQKL